MKKQNDLDTAINIFRAVLLSAAIWIIVIIGLLSISGCATQKPIWQQDIENINRQWRAAPGPINYPTAFVSPREKFNEIGLCRYK